MELSNDGAILTTSVSPVPQKKPRRSSLFGVPCNITPDSIHTPNRSISKAEEEFYVKLLTEVNQWNEIKDKVKHTKQDLEIQLNNNNEPITVQLSEDQIDFLKSNKPDFQQFKTDVEKFFKLKQLLVWKHKNIADMKKHRDKLYSEL